MKRKLLFAVMTLITGAWALSASAQTWTPSEVGAGSFYLYNVGSEKYLTGGNAWGTHASIDAHGLYCTLAVSGEGYSIATGRNRYLGTDGFVDNSNPTPWVFTAVEGLTNTYTVYNSTLGYLVATDGSTDLSASADAPTNNYGYWKLASRDALLAAADLDNASETNPIDLTFLLGGVNFVRNCDGWENNPGAKSGSVTGGWTYTVGGNNFVFCGPSGQTQTNTGCEMWNNTFDVNQTATVPNGKYYVTCDGFGSANTVIYANESEKAFTMTGNVSGHNFNNVLLNIGSYHEGGKTDVVTVASGSIKVGVKRSVTNSEWTVIDNFRLYYVGKIDMSEFETALSEALTSAKAVDTTKPMEASLLSALQTVINTYDGASYETQEEYTAAISAVTNATNAANNSITAYANAKAYLDKMAAVLDNTNVYTQESYDAKYGTWLAAYNEKTLDTETAAGLNANTAYSTGWHSASNIDDILLSTWTIGGTQCKDFETSLYINTWSTEGATDGSEFLAPFFEYWVADGQVLGANTLVSKVTDLTPNTTYSFTIRARVRQTNSKVKIANGVTMQVGEGTAVDISAGAQFNAGQFYIGNFSAVGTTDENGTLTTTITVAENSNISWLSFYNCKYAEGEDLSAYIADYQFALANVNAALAADALYASMQGDLQTAATTYATVDETNKAALIEAKEALETALAAYNAVVAPLKGNNLTGWTTTGNNGNFEVNTWSTEGNSDGSNMTTPFSQNWIGRGTSLTDATMSYTVENLTPGYYKVTALVRSLNEAGGATPAGSFIFANDNIERAYNGTACTNGVYANPVVYGLVGEDGKLTFGVKIIKANVNWVSWKNFVYEYVGTELTSEIAANQTEEARIFENATTSEAVVNQASAVDALATLTDANYTAAGKAIEAAYLAIDREFGALAAAIAAAEEYTLGFEAGEYAPYNLGAPLAAAQAIDQTSEANTQAEINAATAALTAVAANTEEVNAIYGGDFTKYETVGGQDLPFGWNLYNTGNNSRIMGGTEGASNAGLAAASSGKALLMKFNATYGESTGYTMPLKANRIYKIVFKYGGWGNTPTTNIVLNDPNGETIALAPGFKPTTNDAQNDASHWYDYVGYFASTTTGDYTISFNKVESGQQQIIIADIDLRTTTDVLNFADGAVPTYAPGTYPSVKISRSLTADKWVTAVYPFNVSAAGLTYATLNDYVAETGELKFQTATASAANVPFLMKATADMSEISLSNVEVKAAAVQDESKGDATFKGTYSPVTVTGEATNVVNYVVSNNNLYKVGVNDANVGIYRGYLQIAVTSGEVKPLFLSFDGGDATAIRSIDESGVQLEGKVYDLSGRAVANPTRGMYIINGKKVLLK